MKAATFLTIFCTSLLSRQAWRIPPTNRNFFSGISFQERVLLEFIHLEYSTTGSLVSPLSRCPEI